MSSKTYKLPNGKQAVFEYDITGVGKITLECMDELMAMIADRPSGEWLPFEYGDDTWHKCSVCGIADKYKGLMPRPNGTIAEWEYVRNYCPNCGAKMTERKTEPIIDVYNGNADKENWQCITIKPIDDDTQNACTNCKCTDDCSECEEAEHGCKDEPQTERSSE